MKTIGTVEPTEEAINRLETEWADVALRYYTQLLSNTKTTFLEEETQKKRRLRVVLVTRPCKNYIITKDSRIDRHGTSE